jgi:hypothetical protein
VGSRIILQLILTWSVCVAPAAAATLDDGARPGTRVLLVNEAGVPATMVSSVQAEVTRLYALIDVDVEWVTRVPGPAARVQVVSVVAWEPEARDLATTVLGFAPKRPGTRGTLSYVFFARVERTAQRFKVRVDNVLAVAIAHELAHMVLTGTAHVPSGLMQETWDDIRLQQASAGLLLFSADSAASIRRSVAEMNGPATVTAGR